MTTTFGGSDAEGAWLWRDAYDAIEAALVLQLRRLAPADRPAGGRAGRDRRPPGQPRRPQPDPHRAAARSRWRWTSSPPRPSWARWRSSRPRCGPATRCWSRRPARACWPSSPRPAAARLTLNELAAGRVGLLEGLFPAAARSQHDAEHLRDILPASGAFHVVLANPPFQQLEAHLHAALDCLADGGRLSAIVPARLFEDAAAMRALAAARPRRPAPGLPGPRLRQARDLGRDRPAGGRPRREPGGEIPARSWRRRPWPTRPRPPPASPRPADRPAAPVPRPSPTSPSWRPGPGRWRRPPTGWPSCRTTAPRRL